MSPVYPGDIAQIDNLIFLFLQQFHFTQNETVSISAVSCFIIIIIIINIKTMDSTLLISS